MLIALISRMHYVRVRRWTLACSSAILQVAAKEDQRQAVRMSRVGVSKSFRKVTHAIFDMDGLLLDTEILYTEATQRILDDFGKTYSWEVKCQLMGMTGAEAAKKIVETYELPITWEEYMECAKRLYDDVMPRAALMPGAILARHDRPYTPEMRTKVLGMQGVDTCKTLVRLAKLPISWQEMHARFQPALLAKVQTTALLPGVENLIKHLHKHNIACAVATSSTRRSYDIKTNNHKEFFGLFQHIVTGGSDEEVKHGKPAPDIFKLAADRFADKPKYEDCLVFEDAPNGVQGALAAGMQVVMVPDEHTSSELCKDATVVLKSLEEFQPELFGLPAFSKKCIC